MNQIRQRQAGATLLVSLIILALMSAFAATSFNLGKSSLQIVDNFRQNNQAVVVAQEAIETVISSSDFTRNPGSVFRSQNNRCPSGLSAPPNSLCVDVNGDGKTVFVATLTPQPACIRWNSLVNDLTCSSGGGSGQNFGVPGSNTGGSLCADSLWEVTAQAFDPVSNAQATVTEGVALRILASDLATNCPSTP